MIESAGLLRGPAFFVLGEEIGYPGIMTLSTKQLSFVIVLLAACGGDDNSTGDEDTTGMDDGSTSSAMTMTSSPTTDPDSDSSGVDPTLTTASESDTGSTSVDPSDTTTDPDGSTGSDTGTATVCEPANTDDECNMCLKENCCDAMTMCVEADPQCACVLDCMAELDDPGPSEAQMCAADCGTV